MADSCPSCGGKMGQGMVFCPFCGLRVGEGTAVETEQFQLRACLRRGCLAQVASQGRRRLSIRWIIAM